MSRQSSTAAPFGAVVLLIVATLLQISLSTIQQGIAVLAVYFRQDLHLSLAQMGAIISAIYFGRIVGNTASGPLVDRFGPRRYQMWGAVLVVSFTLLMVFLQTYIAILGGLFLLGLALAVGPSAGSQSIFQAFSVERRGLAMGIRQAGVPFGGALAAALIPSLLARIGFTGVWVSMACVVGIMGVLFTAVAPTMQSGSAPERLFAPLSDLRRVWIGWLFGFLMAAGQSSTVSFVIVDLHAVHGWPITFASTGLAVALAGGGVGRVGAGWMSDRLGGRRPLVLGGIGFLSAAMALLMGWLPAGTPALLLVPVLFALGFGTLGWNSVTLTWAGERVGKARSGQAMSWTASFVSLGMMVDPPTIGRLLDLTHRYSLAWTAVGVVLLAATVVVILGSREPASGERREGSGPGTAPAL